MRINIPRNHLNTKYPRNHYNKNHKAKLSFDSLKEALAYLVAHKLLEYHIYQCAYCSKYHITHL